MRSNPACTPARLRSLRTRHPGARAILAVVLLAACDAEPVVAPPAAVVFASASRAGLSAAATDRGILIALYEATDGPNWVNSENWLTDAPLGDWYGVDTDASGRVVRLDLAGRWDDEASHWVRHGLAGTIPAALGGLANLEGLTLSHNELSGDIPVELGGLADLERLSLGDNELSGSIPVELGSLTKLGTLWLANNQLSGPIPPELGNLASVWQMSFAGNVLSGAIPPELGGLTNLNTLYLSGNQLSGTVPLSFQQLSELEYFGFGRNADLCLPDVLVAWYQTLAEGNGPVCPDREVLRALYEAAGGGGWTNSDGWLGGGPLGEWYGVDVDASGLVSTVDLEANGLSGSLTGRLGELAGLTTLRVGDNDLSGRLPSSLSGTPLRELRYANTDLCVPIEAGFREWLASIPQYEGTGLQCPPPPDRAILIALYEATGGPDWENSANWLTDAPLRDWYGVEAGTDGAVVSLYLGSNGLTGPIPGELGSLAHLLNLDLSYNQLSGTVPLSFLELSQLREFRFGENSGLCLPADLLPWYESIERREGTVCPDAEVLRALYEAAGGGGWTNSDGWLGGGPLGEWYGVDVDASGLVSTVDLEANGLSGSLTGRLGELAGLTTLRVGDNDLSGRLPSSLSGTPLRELRYANTDLCVPIEAWFREWLASIPQHEGTDRQCSPLSDRDILIALYEATGGPDWENSANWLTDAPLGEWYGVEAGADGAVVGLDLRWNGLKGPIPRELGGLASLETLILFDNELTGPIPGELGALAKARLVVLAANHLSGPIPPELGRLADVRGLHLNSNQLTSVPPELGGLAELEELGLEFNELTSVPPELGRLGNLQFLSLNFNQLTSVPADLGELGNLRALSLNFNQLTSVPAQLGGLAKLQSLGLWSNELASVPPELGNLANLGELDLDENRLTSVPREFARLESLRFLWLGSNELMSVPPELGELGNLILLQLEGNRLTEIPHLGPGDFARLEFLDLSSNEFASFPRELGELANLKQLELGGNRLTDIPPGIAGAAGAERIQGYVDELPSFPGRLSESDRPWVDPDGNQMTFASRKAKTLRTLRAHSDFDGNPSTVARSHGGGFASLEVLDLSSNEFSGPLPAGLVELTGLTSLGLADNAGLAGALPLNLTALERLEDLHTTGTELCAPTDAAFLDWLQGVTRQRVTLCGPSPEAAAYLIQVVQSREFPVPLVAGEPALLRVFVTTEWPTTAGMPPVRATFYRDGAVIHEANVPAGSGPIPSVIDESSLSNSVNTEIPGWVIQPGLEVVIEPDPDGMLDPALGVARRIPRTGRMAVGVHTMPVFELTLVPFLWEESPDASILEVAAAMAGDPEGHELFEHTRLLLPVSTMDVKAHASVTTSTNNGFAIMEQTEMIRVMEGGRGHFLAVMAPPTTPGGLLGVAHGIGSWSSFSVLDSETIAHEFGHNRNLYHAPCGGAGGPDRYYPYDEGSIGAWGYDPRTGNLVPPGQPDLMSYCDPYWISDYQFTNALRYRMETESGSILIAAAAPRAAPAQTLLLWGGLDPEGATYLRPAFVIDAPPTLPAASGDYSLTGRDPAGAELFSLSFDMAEFTDTEDGRAGFSFALPVTWTEELASIALQGPGGSATLDRDTDDPLTILRDPATGQVRGILDSPPPAAVELGPQAGPGQGFEVLFSRGIPSPGND